LGAEFGNELVAQHKFGIDGSGGVRHLAGHLPDGEGSFVGGDDRERVREVTTRTRGCQRMVNELLTLGYTP